MEFFPHKVRESLGKYELAFLQKRADDAVLKASVPLVASSALKSEDHNTAGSISKEFWNISKGLSDGSRNSYSTPHMKESVRDQVNSEPMYEENQVNSLALVRNRAKTARNQKSKKSHIQHNSSVMIRGINLSSALSKYHVCLENGKISIVGKDVSEIDLVPISLRNRIEKLFLSGNHLVSVGRIDQFVSLKCLSLANNLIASIQDLAPLSDLKLLDQLSLEGNKVCRSPYYRQYVISMCPMLRLLDKIHIQATDVQQAREIVAMANASLHQLTICCLNLVMTQHTLLLLALHMELIRTIRGRFSVSRSLSIASGVDCCSSLLTSSSSIRSVLDCVDLIKRFGCDQKLVMECKRLVVQTLTNEWVACHARIRADGQMRVSTDPQSYIDIWNDVHVIVTRQMQLDTAKYIGKCDIQRDRLILLIGSRSSSLSSSSSSSDRSFRLLDKLTFESMQPPIINSPVGQSYDTPDLQLSSIVSTSTDNLILTSSIPFHETPHHHHHNQKRLPIDSSLVSLLPQEQIEPSIQPAIPVVNFVRELETDFKTAFNHLFGNNQAVDFISRCSEMSNRLSRFKVTRDSLIDSLADEHDSNNGHLTLLQRSPLFDIDCLPSFEYILPPDKAHPSLIIPYPSDLPAWLGDRTDVLTMAEIQKRIKSTFEIAEDRDNALNAAGQSFDLCLKIQSDFRRKAAFNAKEANRILDLIRSKIRDSELDYRQGDAIYRSVLVLRDCRKGICQEADEWTIETNQIHNISMSLRQKIDHENDRNKRLIVAIDEVTGAVDKAKSILSSHPDVTMGRWLLVSVAKADAFYVKRVEVRIKRSVLSCWKKYMLTKRIMTRMINVYNTRSLQLTLIKGWRVWKHVTQVLNARLLIERNCDVRCKKTMFALWRNEQMLSMTSRCGYVYLIRRRMSNMLLKWKLSVPHLHNMLVHDSRVDDIVDKFRSRRNIKKVLFNWKMVTKKLNVPANDNDSHKSLQLMSNHKLLIFRSWCKLAEVNRSCRLIRLKSIWNHWKLQYVNSVRKVDKLTCSYKQTILLLTHRYWKHWRHEARLCRSFKSVFDGLDLLARKFKMLHGMTALFDNAYSGLLDVKAKRFYISRLMMVHFCQWKQAAKQQNAQCKSIGLLFRLLKHRHLSTSFRFWARQSLDMLKLNLMQSQDKAMVGCLDRRRKRRTKRLVFDQLKHNVKLRRLKLVMISKCQARRVRSAFRLWRSAHSRSAIINNDDLKRGQIQASEVKSLEVQSAVLNESINLMKSELEEYEQLSKLHELSEVSLTSRLEAVKSQIAQKLNLKTQQLSRQAEIMHDIQIIREKIEKQRSHVVHSASIQWDQNNKDEDFLSQNRTKDVALPKAKVKPIKNNKKKSTRKSFDMGGTARVESPIMMIDNNRKESLARLKQIWNDVDRKTAEFGRKRKLIDAQPKDDSGMTKLSRPSAKPLSTRLVIEKSSKRPTSAMDRRISEYEKKLEMLK